MVDTITSASIIVFECDVILIWDCELEALYEIVIKERFMKNVMVPIVFGLPFYILSLLAIYKSFKLKPGEI